MKILSLKVFLLFFAPLIIISACSNNGVSKEDFDRAIAERDSCQTALNYLNGYLGEVYDCVDSISTQEGLLITNVDPETGKPLSRNEIRERVLQFASLIERQRNRIDNLTDSLRRAGSGSRAEIARLTQMITYLNAQLEAKEIQMQQLESELASSRSTIVDLSNSIEDLNTTNASLTEKNEALDRTVSEQAQKIEEMNDAYFLAANQKTLEAAGAIQPGGFLKKSKTKVGNVDLSKCKKVDIRSFTSATLSSKKEPELISPAPQGSYRFEKTADRTWKFIISNPSAFWSLSNAAIIKLHE